MTEKRKTNPSGSALIIMVATIVFLTLLALAFSRIMVTRKLGTANTIMYASTRSFYIAQAGLEYAIRASEDKKSLISTGLMGSWSFETGVMGVPADIAYDSSGKSNDGVLWPNFPTVAPQWSAGKWNVQTDFAYGGDDGHIWIEYTDITGLNRLTSRGTLGGAERTVALDNTCFSLQFDWDVSNASGFCGMVHVLEPVPTPTASHPTPVPPDPTPTPGCSLDLREEGTLMAWIYPDSFSGNRNRYGGIIHKGDRRNWSDEAYGLQFYRNRRIRIFIFNPASRIRYVDSNIRLQAGRWYHVAGTWNSRRIDVYIDGRLNQSRRNSYEARNTDGALNIGAQLTERYSSSYRNFPFDGRLDDVRIYNRALTAAEIRSCYDSTR